MSFATWLIHTCTIERATETLDAYRNAKQTWAAVAAGVPCRLVEKSARALVSERVESTVITTYTLLVSPDVDLRERDRISRVTLEDGTTVNDTFVVTGILARRGATLRHRSALLSRVE
jgi:hypothetical protein